MAHTLGIVGAGLIGTSLALALKRRAPALHVTGFDADAARAARALELGALDSCVASPSQLDADIIVLAAPVGAMRDVLAALAPADGAVITDVGSVKGAVMRAARDVLGAAAARFVPGHPVAGAERSGPDAASASLFDNCRVVLTPDAAAARDATGRAATARAAADHAAATTDRNAVAAVAALWRDAGAAEVIEMDAVEHDRVFACASHLPHAVAYALMDGLLSRADAGAIFDCAAGGLRDFTRVAASDPVMWRDIFLANAGGVLEALDDFSAAAARLRDLIARGDGDALQKLLEEVAARRRDD